MRKADRGCKKLAKTGVRVDQNWPNNSVVRTVHSASFFPGHVSHLSPAANAGRQARLKAGARNKRTLEAVA